MGIQMQVSQFPVDVLTGHFQISGQLKTIGNPGIYLNDAQYSTIQVRDATVTPLAPGTPVGAMARGELYVPKREPEVLIVGGLTIEDVQPLPRKEHLVVFTDTYVIRATFYMGTEMEPEDAFFTMTGPFFPASDAEVYSIRPLTQEVAGVAPVVFVHRDAMRLFHMAEAG